MRTILDHGFTEEQLKSIYNKLDEIHKTNTNIGTNSKIDGIQYFTDKNSNFYISYCYTSYSDYMNVTLMYFNINPFGATIYLNDLYNNVSDISLRFNKYFEIKL